MKITFKLFFILILLFSISCTKEKAIIDKIDFHYNYFPIDTGYWIMYQVDSLVWDDFTEEHYHYKYQVLELFESKFYDSEANEAVRIERYQKLNDTTDWIISDVWFANLYANSAQKVEENIRYVKLIFPIKENAKWNGNAFNQLQNEEYTYSSIHTPLTISNFIFDSTLTVKQNYKHNLIEELDKYEIYACDVGMIEKYHKDLTKNIVTGEIVKGVEVSYKIIDYKLK